MLRAAGLFGVWMVIGGDAGLADLATGLVTAALAAWVSLRLLPPVEGLRPLALAALLLRLPWQAARAGLDVARLALDPRRTVCPGVLPVAPRLPPGTTRDGFLGLSSLLPGTLPAGVAADGRLLIHTLDAAQPVAGPMARDEAAFARAVGRDV